MRTGMHRGLSTVLYPLAVALVVTGLWLAVDATRVDAQDASGAESAGAPADLAHGEDLFALCTYCHGPAGLGNPELGAPAIAGMPEWYISAQLEKFRGGLRGLHPDDFAGMRMRPMTLTLTKPGDIPSVSAYVASLPQGKPESRLEGGDPAKGAGLYAVCASCHGPQAAGNQGLGAPPLTHSGDWYLVEQLKKFKGGLRGTNPKDTTGLTMRPMAAILADEQAMKDVAAHIMTLAE